METVQAVGSQLSKLGDESMGSIIGSFPHLYTFKLCGYNNRTGHFLSRLSFQTRSGAFRVVWP